MKSIRRADLRGTFPWARRVAITVATLATLATLAAAPAIGAAAVATGASLHISTLSNRPDKLSGGDALVAIDAPASIDLSAVAVRLNGADISKTFAPEAGTHRLVGLVRGLKVGNNELTASAPGVASASQALVDYSSDGPIFSGPKQAPYYCQTHKFEVYPGGPMLTAKLIVAPCNVPTRIDYLYRTKAGAFAPFNPRGPAPADMVTTTISTGATAPYIVRLETGTINRSVYQTAVLEDPRGAAPKTRNPPAWNQRLVHTFGGGCQPGWYVQGANALFSSPGSPGPDVFLSKGYAVSAASLTTLGNNCNFVLAAETLMMVKEHFTEDMFQARAPGVSSVPLYTMGWGCSGGSIMQNTIADAYPGLLDGIMPQCSFADITNVHAYDVRLLYNYYMNGKSGVTWTQDQFVAVTGLQNFAHARLHAAQASSRFDPLPGRAGFPANSSESFTADVPMAVRYNPATNPKGVRATIWDSLSNLFGRDDKGFGRRPLDNVGVQYGLAALNAGTISKDQFLDLNAKIGGTDIDGNFVADRTVGDPAAVKAAYETGFLNVGGHGLAQTAILDFDQIYVDLLQTGDLHMKFQHFATRERMRNSRGNVDNMVMWSGATTPFTADQALHQMDLWLTALKSDTSSAPLAEKVVKAKPASATDGCWKGKQFIAERQFLGGVGTSVCNTLYPGFAAPRLVAGAPLAGDVLQCQRRPFDLNDYNVKFTDAEIARLRTIFASGVCDFAKKGAIQPELISTWMTYSGDGKYQKDSIQ